MRVRNTTPPRIEWKEKVRGRWVGRTVSVTPENLERYGVTPPANGKPVTARHAHQLLLALQRFRHVAEHPEDPAVSLAELIETYLAKLHAVKNHTDRKVRTLRKPGTRSKISHPKLEDISLLSFLGDVPIAPITADDLLRYQAYLESGGYASQSLRGFLMDVRTVFNFAVRAGYLRTSPAAALRLPPQEPSEEIEFLTKGQVAALLGLVQRPAPVHQNGLSLADVIPGYLYTGCRRTELLKLQWDDIDLKRRVVVIRGARKNPAKREKKRAVPIPVPLFEILLRKPRVSPFVFTNSCGEAWKPDSLNSALTRLRKRCRKELGFDFTPQVLRRTYGSLLYEAGYSMDQVSEFLGNSVEVCKKWYVSLRAEEHHERVTRAFSLDSAGMEKPA